MTDAVVSLKTEPGFCRCERPRAPVILGQPGGDAVRCTLCSKPIRCELGYLDDPEAPHPATGRHIDYLVCARHCDQAVENVLGRRS